MKSGTVAAEETIFEDSESGRGGLLVENAESLSPKKSRRAYIRKEFVGKSEFSSIVPAWMLRGFFSHCLSQGTGGRGVIESDASARGA